MFEKILGDLLEQTDDVAFLKINEQEEFAPIIYKSGKYSPEDAIQKLSNLHKKWMHMTRKTYQKYTLSFIKNWSFVISSRIKRSRDIRSVPFSIIRWREFRNF
jgi:hypothetical protein